MLSPTEEDISFLPIAPHLPDMSPECCAVTAELSVAWVTLRDTTSPIASDLYCHLELHFSIFPFLRLELRHFSFPQCPGPLETFYTLTSEFFDSWRNRRRSGRGGRRRNRGNSPPPQGAQPVCPRGTWRTAGGRLILPGTGESWAAWRGVGGRLNLGHPRTYHSVSPAVPEPTPGGQHPHSQPVLTESAQMQSPHR